MSAVLKKTELKDFSITNRIKPMRQKKHPNTQDVELFLMCMHKFITLASFFSFYLPYLTSQPKTVKKYREGNSEGKNEESKSSNIQKM